MTQQCSLDDFAQDINHLRQRVQELGLTDYPTVWMINSTKQGGGVAEMMPTMLEVFKRIGLNVQWEVITTEDQQFFDLTKRLHNSIHGVGCTNFTEEDCEIHGLINIENFADHLEPCIQQGDIVVIHDPQPMPLVYNVEEICPVVWRCHIGLDYTTKAGTAAWNFLSEYAEHFDLGVFSMESYVPDCFANKAEIISPAIDPTSPKNRPLSPIETAEIFLSLGFDATDPYFLQVSRWDKLKGWKELVETFNRAWVEQAAVRHSDFRLVLAGPDPSAVADDPEGVECYREICELVEEYVSFYGTPIEMLSLDMTSREQNALMVNALQTHAAVIVQNSVQEGFGLTVTEAMYKSKPVLGSTAAGIRRQIKDGVNGWICDLPWHLKHHIVEICSKKYDLETLGKNARETVESEFLVFRQIERYLEIFAKVR